MGVDIKWMNNVNFILTEGIKEINKINLRKAWDEQFTSPWEI